MLASHLAAVGPLFALVHRLTGDARVAAIGALLWGTTPVHAETLGWFSVYGQVIASVAILLALLVVLSGRNGDSSHRALLIVIPVLLLTGALAYGVGIASALAFPAVVWLLLPAGPARRRTTTAAALVAVGVVPIYHLTLGDAGLRGMASALLARPGVLVAVVARDLVSLLVNGVTRLHLGAYAAAPRLSAGLLATVTLIWVFAIGAALARESAARRRQMAAFAMLVLAVYTSIAIGRGFTLAIWGVKDMGSVGRYHYAATAALAVLSGLALNALAANPRVPAVTLDTVLAAVLVGVVAGRATTPLHINDHAAEREETARVLATC